MMSKMVTCVMFKPHLFGLSDKHFLLSHNCVEASTEVLKFEP